MASAGRRGLAGLNAYERHKKLVHDYLTYYGGQLPSRTPGDATVKTDWDSVKEHHRFLRSEDDDKELTWEVKLARKYYAKLFKEYCLADLSRYKESKIGMRWRTEKEVVSGKGQFVCGNKQCSNRLGLASYEVNFGYKEAGEYKQALVKLRVCPDCAQKLNYNRKTAYRRADSSDASAGSTAKRQRVASPELEDDRRDKEKAGRPREVVAVSAGESQQTKLESNVWAQQEPQKGEATQEDEFDKYFHDMFL